MARSELLSAPARTFTAALARSRVSTSSAGGRGVGGGRGHRLIEGMKSFNEGKANGKPAR